MSFPWIGKSDDGQTITIKKLNEEMFDIASYCTEEWLAQNPDKYSIGAAVDIETTGLEYNSDTIIEIGIRIFVYSNITGEVLYRSIECYSGLQDPGKSLSEDIKTITGISDDMLKGKSIDWDRVEKLLSMCHVIIAHNALFDRPFIDRLSTVSRNKIWGCSLNQINWKSLGFTSNKLELLSIYHGFFTDAHRALNDADALIYLLSLTNHKTQIPYLSELLTNANKSTFRINALQTKFEKKELLKLRQYRWDPQNRFWFIDVSTDQFQSEIKWLEENIYLGDFLGNFSKILPINNFKKN